MFTLPLPWPETYLLLSPPWAGLPAAVRWPLLFAVLVLPLVLLVTLYRYELRLVPRLTAFGLFSLRFVVFVLVLTLVCLQPIYARDRTTQLPGRVLVALDRSLSMDVRDPQRAGGDKLRLARALGLTRGVVGDDVLARWIDSHDQRRDPQMVLDGEKDVSGPDRQKAHDGLIAAIDALTRSEVARRLLADDGLKLLSKIQEKHEVELVGFHRDLWDMAPEQLADLSAAREMKDSASDPSAFTDLRNPLLRAQQNKVMAVVLLSDGQHNVGGAVQPVARQLGDRKVPVFPVLLGARPGPPDAVMVSLRGPDYTVFKDVEAVIDARFKIAGLPAQDFVVELFREGKERKLLASKTIAHDGQDRVYAESFPVKMTEPGVQTITAQVRPVQPNVRELSGDNNRLTTTVSVADDRAKVLLVDGEPRWEYHYLVTALQRDRLVDLKTVVFDTPQLADRLTEAQRERGGLPGREWPAGPDALAGYQCIVLGDVDPENLPLARRLDLERYVSESAGTLIIVAGKRAMPLAYAEANPAADGDPLRRLLPIEQPRRLTPANGFPITLTQAGRDARYMELDSDRTDNDTLWAGFPRPWLWGVAGRAKPGAAALAGWLDPTTAKLPLPERERQHALVARHNYGFGRVLYLGLDGTWRWRYKVGDLYHHKFWGQVIRWAAADRPLVVGNEFVRFGTPQPVYRRGEAVEVVARLGESLGVIRADLLAGARLIRLGEGTEPEQLVALLPLAKRAGQPRVLEGQLRDLPPGRYAVELAIPDYGDKLMSSPKDGKDVKPLRATFSVTQPESKELIDVELNLPLLDDIAKASGGRVFSPSDVAELEKLLVRQGVPHVEHQEDRLWQWWGFLVLVVGLLTAEWGWRKLSGLP